MIHLLLLIGAAGASSSSSIEGEFFGGVAAGASRAIGVGAGSTAEIDTPGRALAAGKCCKRAAKHKRKKLQLKAKWQECEEAAAAPAEGTGAAAGGGQCTQAELDAATKGLFTQDDLDEAKAAAKKDLFTQADVDAARQAGIESVTPEDGVTQADVDAARQTAETEKQTALAAAETEKQTALAAAAAEKAAALQAAEAEKAAALAEKDQVIKDAYQLKTCGPAPEEGCGYDWAQGTPAPPGCMQLKGARGHGALTKDTVCGDPTGQTNCATECFEPYVKKPYGASCVESWECQCDYCPLSGARASGLCCDYYL